ncbi:hypothetical protein R6Q59_005460 [Mikania micrantha]|uniref:CCT domain-containing protein n=1 Tax=Mikania micrantha TaxID=192012 RepID=A0A5N6Q461_9ASTR|nr:hypothetical protein E3N88_01913 [Mikania micrantha]
MLSSDKHLANVVGGKTARPCDNCVRKRARWYCAADDAFLCQSCDTSVHAANPLARRHERVRLKIASLKLSSLDKLISPPWHQGFTKKPRTPRGGNHQKDVSRQTTKSEESGVSLNPLHLVPEIGDHDETTTLTCDDQLLYQVPVLDPFAVKLCLSDHEMVKPVKQPEVKAPADADHQHGSKLPFDLNSLNGLILPTDVELAEFAADVENILGKDLEDKPFAMDGLGLSDSGERDSVKSLDQRVKVEEDDDQMQYEISEMEMLKEPFQLSFDYDSPAVDEGGGYGGDLMAVVKADDEDDHVAGNIYGGNKKKKIILKLDFEGIIAAWDEQRSPWTTGDRPELHPDDCWPECMGGCGIIHHHYQNHPYGDMGMMRGNPTMIDGGREARVSRYREKRRTRLFSKKIRYEVRKLNAEKRPRMKGRFVKRASSSGFPLLT